MAPCFVPSLTLTSTKTTFTTNNRCQSSPIVNRSLTYAIVPKMTAASSDGEDTPKKTEEKGLGAWIYRKMMHNALWEGDENVGYEPFFQEAMSARDQKKKQAYEEQDSSN